MKKVLLFGTFDGVHAGHKDLLRQAQELGDEVMVVVARDVTVERVKKRTPNNSEQLRLKEIRLQRGVTAAQLGVVGSNKYDVIAQYKPDTILLGYDQEAFIDKLKDYIEQEALDIDITRALAYYPEQYKSSLINKYL
jgi:FAD synthetase